MARLLVVDDEPDIRDTVTQLVAALMPDVQVLAVGNGADALKALQAQDFDLVLTDYRMPAMDGVALVQAIMQRWPWMPVRMFTAFMDPAMLAEVHARLPDLKIIPKPLDIDFLVAQLREALREAAAAGHKPMDHGPA